MANMNQILILEAKANLKEAWEDLISLADVPDKDKQLTRNELDDPNHPVTALILYICQMQCFVLPEINRAIQTQDQTKVKTLGPFDWALDRIIGGAQRRRTDIEKYDCSKQQDLWRCGGMTAP